MREYEMMLLLDAELDEEARGAVFTKAQESVKKGGGKWISTDDWGRRKLAYEINKKPDAHYSLSFLECSGDALAEMTHLMRITDGVMRVMAVTRVPDAPAEIEKAALEAKDERGDRDRDRGDRGDRGGRGGGGGGRGRGRGRD